MSRPATLDPGALRRARRHLASADPVMARLAGPLGPSPIGIHRRGSAFTYLARAILAQQISVAAARSIAARLTARFGWPWRPEHVLGATDAELRSLGLSRQKAAYLRDLAARTRDGLPLGRLSRLSDERVIETLTAVKGIGRWTAEMYLMFRLGRPDVLPVDDLGIQTAMRRAYRMRGKPRKERMRRIAEAWRPYRTVACFYLWRSLEEPPAVSPRGARSGNATRGPQSRPIPRNQAD
jgi:3-methyladenine DNA glycosylase/8-oxoguanine DNA glycosylase